MEMEEVANGVTLRPMRQADLGAVLAIQRLAYGDDYQEDAEVFARKLALAPAACWFAEHGDKALGYVFAHPWSSGVPRLHSPIERLPDVLEQGFLHDLAVSPAARGLGLGRALFGKVQAWSRASNLQALGLVALADAIDFWRGLGFAADGAELPCGYGAGALYMRRSAV
ncbi:GCN5-like N-acetyltransferase [Thauera sp. 28]|uniref:GNAT family N-acetyltransferase n=1 Tax=Thauera sp. 28 TaxID=303682 RepID=UPI0002CF3611|nr:GNAT family N-acetyltransferase [Thauera sp. 28]ENO92390.1 GCN5-like N-acetyltransferase [Thauera sp. 28]HNR59881.1 GNAT family N-acetyltransferase [Thauera sp.]